MTEGRAVFIGTLVVNLPVFTFLFGPVALLFLSKPDNWLIYIAVITSGFILAWLWWSLTVPKWRLWAYKRVKNIEDLKERAIAAGLTWPDDSIFNRTEIKSSEHAKQERELEKNEVK